jgi:hypothetical protein
LQTTLTAQVEQVKALETQAAQNQQYAATLEGQLSTATQNLQQSVAQNQALLQQAQQGAVESQFYGILTQEYPDLLGIAAGLQRAPDAEGQRAIFNSVRSGLQGQVQQGVQNAIVNQLQGAVVAPQTPTGAGGPPDLPPYEEVMDKLLDDNWAKAHPEEYQKMYQIYQTHPGFTHESLGTGPFRDTMPNHYQSMRIAQGAEPVPGSQPGAPGAVPQAFNTGVQAGPFNPPGGIG